MSMTDIRSDIQALLPSGYFANVLTDAKLLALINAAQRWVCRGTYINNEGRRVNHNFSWLTRECTQSTTDEQQRYSLPDGTLQDAGGQWIWRFKNEISAELIDYQSHRVPLVRTFKGQVENDPRFVDSADVGKPRAYVVDQQQLWLYPKPDHGLNNNSPWTINLEYYGYLPDLSVSEPSNYLTAHCPEILTREGLGAAYEVGHDYDNANYWHNKAQELLIELINEDVAGTHSGIETGLRPTLANAAGYGSAAGAEITTSGGYAD